MPHYYFDVDDHGYEADDRGEDFAGLAEARAAAVLFAGEMMRDEPSLVTDGRALRVNVNDGDHVRQFCVVVTIEDA